NRQNQPASRSQQFSSSGNRYYVNINTMASSHISTQIGVLLTILVSTVLSQMAGPAAQPPMDLSSMLANSGSFPQSGFSGGLPPSGFPQMQMAMPNMAPAPQPRQPHAHSE
ncbi:unnamed protein product, partial [Lymnaea stagnalis]